jgi:mannitol/fructose-specific phosphotransferase system IIA component (Ntr-type)
MGGGASMRVSDALVGSAVIVQPAWRTFDDAIAGLVDRLVASARLPEELASVAVARIREREAMASTAMVDIGVSIPHARLDGITAVVAAIAVSPHAVYQVADGLPISIVALALSSPSVSGEHLNFLSSLSLLLQSARIRERLRNAATPDDVLRLIRANEQARG